MSNDVALEEVRTRRLSYPLGSGQAEELALAAGLKPVVRQLLEPGEIDVAKERFERAGLHVGIAEKRYVRMANGYVRVEGQGKMALYAARDAGRARDAAASDADVTPEATRELGRLLGYPRCCVDAFVSVPPPRANVALAAAALARTDGAPLPRLNVLDLAVFHFLPWAPCSYRCALSARYADAVAELVSRRFPTFVTAIDEALAAHRLMADDDVQVSMRGAFADGSVAIERVWPTAIDRHPSAALAPEAEARVARLLARLRTCRRLVVSERTATADGEPLEPPTRFVLAPFGAVRS